MALNEMEVVRQIQALQRDVKRLELLTQCPRCHGTGSIEINGEPDECPDCHGDKVHPALISK